MPMLRPMTLDDLDQVMEVQRDAALVAFEHIFPPDQHPYPDDQIRAGWEAEIADPAMACFVVLRDHEIAGHVVLRGDELVHFGVARECWGTGLAHDAHDAAIRRIREAGHQSAFLMVLEDNLRAKRFYERHGWHPTGVVRRAPFPPEPVLRRYEIALDRHLAPID